MNGGTSASPLFWRRKAGVVGQAAAADVIEDEAAAIGSEDFRADILRPLELRSPAGNIRGFPIEPAEFGLTTAGLGLDLLSVFNKALPMLTDKSPVAEVKGVSSRPAGPMFDRIRDDGQTRRLRFSRGYGAEPDVMRRHGRRYRSGHGLDDVRRGKGRARLSVGRRGRTTEAADEHYDDERWRIHLQRKTNSNYASQTCSTLRMKLAVKKHLYFSLVLCD